MDGVLVRELFLERVLTSTKNTTSLEDLSQLADHIMKAALSPIAAIKPTTIDLPMDVAQLRAEVSRLADIVASLSPRDQDTSRRLRRINPQLHHHHQHPSKYSAGTTSNRRCSTKLQTTVLTIGKLPGQPLAATSVAGLSPSLLFYITDKLTGARFLVNTGAEVSVIPSSQVEQRKGADHLTLQAINNTSIPTYGKKNWILDCVEHFAGYLRSQMLNTPFSMPTSYAISTS